MANFILTDQHKTMQVTLFVMSAKFQKHVKNVLNNSDQKHSLPTEH